MQSRQREIKTYISIFIICILTLVAGFPSSAAPSKSELMEWQLKPHTIPALTKIKFASESELSAKKSEVGDDFIGRVAEHIWHDDILVVPAGSWVLGKVSYVNRPRRVTNGGKLGLTVNSIVTVYGDVIPLNATFALGGRANKKGIIKGETNYADSLLKPTKSLLSRSIGRTVTFATLGASTLVTLPAGAVYGILRKGDNPTITIGETMEIVSATDITVR